MAAQDEGEAEPGQGGERQRRDDDGDRVPFAGLGGGQSGVRQGAGLLRCFDGGGVHVARQANRRGLKLDLLDEAGFQRRQQGAHRADMVGFAGLLGDLVQMPGYSGHGAGDLFPKDIALAG